MILFVHTTDNHGIRRDIARHFVGQELTDTGILNAGKRLGQIIGHRCMVIVKHILLIIKTNQNKVEGGTLNHRCSGIFHLFKRIEYTDGFLCGIRYRLRLLCKSAGEVFHGKIGKKICKRRKYEKRYHKRDRKISEGRKHRILSFTDVTETAVRGSFIIIIQSLKIFNISDVNFLLFLLLTPISNGIHRRSYTKIASKLLNLLKKPFLYAKYLL